MYNSSYIESDGTYRPMNAEASFGQRREESCESFINQNDSSFDKYERNACSNNSKNEKKGFSLPSIFKKIEVDDLILIGIALLLLLDSDEDNDIFVFIIAALVLLQ